jgi:hypothetical protein
MARLHACCVWRMLEMKSFFGFALNVLYNLSSCQPRGIKVFPVRKVD